jgi:hypothetical protein
LFNEYTNRNVMTLDGWDWTHRTGDGGEDNSSDPDYAACSETILRPFGDPRPQTYEGTFAHEYQHLLEYYESPGEANFVNEGLSDWAQTLVKYVDPSLDPASPDADGHLQTWMGFNDDQGFGGPEQSLTRWQDQGAPEILADYGMAYAFMEYLNSHFGDGFMTALHRENKNGFAGLQAVMTQFDVGGTPLGVIHDFLASMALDQQIEGTAGKTLVHGDTGKLNTATMSARINWDTPQANSTPGAPTNGADWLAVPGGDGQYSSTVPRATRRSRCSGRPTGTGCTPAPATTSTGRSRASSPSRRTTARSRSASSTRRRPPGTSPSSRCTTQTRRSG